MSFWTVLSCCFSSNVKTPSRPVQSIYVNEVQVSALLDTGSSVTLINSKLKSKILQKGSNTAKSPSIKLCGAGGTELKQNGCFSLQIKLNGKKLFHNCLFIDQLQVPCILGMDFMPKIGAVIDTNTNTISFSTNPSNRTRQFNVALCNDKPITLLPFSENAIELPCSEKFSQGLIESASSLPDQVMVMDGITSSSNNSCVAIVSNLSHLPIRLPSNTPIANVLIDPSMTITPLSQCLNINSSKPIITDTHHIDSIDLTHVPDNYQSRYCQLLRTYADVFSKNDLDLGHCKTLPHVVKLTDPNKIVAINQYRLPHHLKEVAIDYVQKLLAAGVVCKSNSVFNSPLMLVKKPRADPNKPLNEQYRLVHNYVEVNKNIAPCSYPLRRLYELLDEVASGKVYSVLDLSQGFFQQQLIDPHEATAFLIPGIRQYTYCRSPQGMNSSPAYFQRLLDFVLREIRRVYVYIDDVVISVQSHEENLSKLTEVFDRFRLHNLKVKPNKCQFGTAKITYLGYDICNEKGISPGQAKTEVIANWPSPTSIREIRGFIGLTSFFRRSIENLSVLSASLNKLIRKDSGYTKGPLPPAALESFQKLKAALISKPCLAAVDFSKRFYLTCDASATHYGACLSQKDSKGNERPCAYASKLLNEKEAKQAPGIRERNALLFAMRHFHPYLVGKEFTVRADHKPNLAIQNGKTKVYDSVSDEIMRYMPFKLEYLNGAKMFADILSRPPGKDYNILTTLTKTTLLSTDTPLLLMQAHDQAGHQSANYTLNHL